MAPARRTAPALAPAPAPAPWSELPEELWAHIFGFAVQDRYRNVTLPALAQLARASRPVSYTHLTLPTTPYV